VQSQLRDSVLMQPAGRLIRWADVLGHRPQRDGPWQSWKHLRSL